MSDSDDDMGLAGIFWGNIGEGGHKLEVDYLDAVRSAVGSPPSFHGPHPNTVSACGSAGCCEAPSESREGDRHRN